MSVLFILIIICPGVIAEELYRYVSKEEYHTERFLVYVAEFALAITWLSMVVLYLRGWGEFAFSCLTVQFLVKYMLISTFFAVAVSVLAGMIARKLRRH